MRTNAEYVTVEKPTLPNPWPGLIKPKVAYCDMIAQNIVDLVNRHNDMDLVGRDNGLHPEHGYLVTTTKKVFIKDFQGKEYTITIEEKEQ